MMEVGCECPDGFGAAHSHLYDGLPSLPSGRGAGWAGGGWVRVWIDWKAVARP